MKTETLGTKHTNKLFEKFVPHSQDYLNVPKMKLTMKMKSTQTATVVTMACKKK